MKIKLLKAKPHWAARLMTGMMLLSVLSCGEDRTHEYVELTACDHWMQEVMQTQYLWGSSLKELAWKDYFAEPATFFAKLTAQAPVTDSWSWCATDTLSEDHHERGKFNHLDSYGMDFVVMTDPTGETSRQYARIITVIDNSPAQSCGLERGLFIMAIDGTKFTSSESSKLVNGKARTLTVGRLGVNEEEGTLVWEETKDVALGASTYVEDKAFPLAVTLDTEAGKLGYLMVNRLTEGPTEHDASSTAYRSDLHNVMSLFASQELTGFVVDLRLCNDGEMSMACLLASYLAGEKGRGQVFTKTFHNENRAGENASISYDESCINKKLIYKRLYFVTSSYTQGASEWLIHALQHTLDSDAFASLGIKTAGQNVHTGSIPSDYFVTLHPAVAYVADAADDYNYGSGISPDLEINELSSVELYPYGDPNEIILHTIILDLEAQ